MGKRCYLILALRIFSHFFMIMFLVNNPSKECTKPLNLGGRSQWVYLQETNLKALSTYPNEVVVTWSYESHSDLLVHRTSKNDTQYGYNARDEFISADDLSYSCDDIGRDVPMNVSEWKTKLVSKSRRVRDYGK